MENFRENLWPIIITHGIVEWNIKRWGKGHRRQTTKRNKCVARKPNRFVLCGMHWKQARVRIISKNVCIIIFAAPTDRPIHQSTMCDGFGAEQNGRVKWPYQCSIWRYSAECRYLLNFNTGDPSIAVHIFAICRNGFQNNSWKLMVFRFHRSLLCNLFVARARSVENSVWPMKSRPSHCINSFCVRSVFNQFDFSEVEWKFGRQRHRPTTIEKNNYEKYESVVGVAFRLCVFFA